MIKDIKKLFVKTDSDIYTVRINEDSNRVLKWNRADTKLPVRVKAFEKYLKHVRTVILARLEVLGTSEAFTRYVEEKAFEVFIEFDKAFGSGAYHTIFQGLNPLITEGASGVVLIQEAVNELQPQVLIFKKGEW